MGQRSDLQELLLELCPNVYFQPPPSLAMQYPCVVYQRDYMLDEHADNETYVTFKRYQVTVLDRDPDSTIVDAVKRLALCTYDRFFTVNNLNHDVFKLFF
jgi:hypothetical protein